jgi:hypothetical protein
MRKLVIMTRLFTLAGFSANHARGGGMHGHGASGLMAPANTLAGTCASTAAPLAVFDLQLDVSETHLLPPIQ